MNQIYLKNFPKAIDALARAKQFYSGDPHSFSKATPEPNKLLDNLDMHALTIEFIKLQRDLHLDFVQFRESNLELNNINEPDWFCIDDSTLAVIPEHIAQTLDTLHKIELRLQNFAADTTMREKVLKEWRLHNDSFKAARQILSNLDKKESYTRSIDKVFEVARKSGRSLNIADTLKIQKFKEELSKLENAQEHALVEESLLPLIHNELNRQIRKQNAKELAAGLLLTPQMTEIIGKALPSVINSRPVLLVGETGSAKTALALHLAKKIQNSAPEIVSFHGEINTYQLIGRDRLNSLNGMYFQPGPLLIAMKEGKALILDEINAAPPELLKRLNIIMQLRPGQEYKVQEDSDSIVTVQKGFTIIATANEKSKRYKGIEVLSTELKNRFGTNIFRVTYPDSETLMGEMPAEGLAIAEAALSDEQGNLAVELPPGQLEAFIKAAHQTQKLFSGQITEPSQDNHLEDALSTINENINTGQNILDDSVLSPRMVVSILEQIKDGLGSISLPAVLTDWVRGLESKNDRSVITNLLNGFYSHDFVTLLGNRIADAEEMK